MTGSQHEARQSIYADLAQYDRDVEAFITSTSAALVELLARDYAHQIGPRGMWPRAAGDHVNETAATIASAIGERAMGEIWNRVADAM